MGGIGGLEDDGGRSSEKTVLRTWSVKGMIMNHAFSNPSGYLFPERKKD
jgi:hypothetical protein